MPHCLLRSCPRFGALYPLFSRACVLRQFLDLRPHDRTGHAILGTVLAETEKEAVIEALRSLASRHPDRSVPSMEGVNEEIIEREWRAEAWKVWADAPL